MADDHVSAELRAVVEKLARYCCEYCRYPQKYSPEDRLSLEHILPRSQGGLTELGNLALCCQGCNNHKYNHVLGVDPETNRLTPLFHPRMQRWTDHFRWSEDFVLIEGKSPSGRATIVRLQVNRPGPVNLRRTLIEYGEHPPPGPDPHD
jgi:5-methylcytosine-specific restriction endonuclease McrA